MISIGLNIRLILSEMRKCHIRISVKRFSSRPGIALPVVMAKRNKNILFYKLKFRTNQVLVMVIGYWLSAVSNHYLAFHNSITS